MAFIPVLLRELRPTGLPPPKPSENTTVIASGTTDKDGYFTIVSPIIPPSVPVALFLASPNTQSNTDPEPSPNPDAPSLPSSPPPALSNDPIIILTADENGEVQVPVVPIVRPKKVIRSLGRCSPFTF
jgi:hypothetical protein